MKRFIAPILLLASLFCVFSVAAAPTVRAQSESMPNSKNYIIKLKESGPEPGLLRLRPDDSVVFFLNETKEALATLEVDFTGKTAHCASSNMRVSDDQSVKSVTPFGPKDFATTCFHSPGSYTYKVYGLPANPKGVTGTVVLE